MRITSTIWTEQVVSFMSAGEMRLSIPSHWDYLKILARSIGSVISDINIFLFSTALTLRNVRDVSLVDLRMVRSSCTKKIADRIGLNLLAWVKDAVFALKDVV